MTEPDTTKRDTNMMKHAQMGVAPSTHKAAWDSTKRIHPEWTDDALVAYMDGRDNRA